YLSSGCCTEAFDGEDRASRFLPKALVKENEEGGLYAAYYGFHGGMVLALAGCVWLCRRRLLAVGLAPLLLGAILCGVVNVVFLIEVVAPRLLHLPYHHCPYDLVPRGPEGIVSAARSLGGSFAVGWACVAGWLGRAAESRAYLPATVRALLRVALLSYLWAMLMTF